MDLHTLSGGAEHQGRSLPRLSPKCARGPYLVETDLPDTVANLARSHTHLIMCSVPPASALPPSCF